MDTRTGDGLRGVNDALSGVKKFPAKA